MINRVSSQQQEIERLLTESRGTDGSLREMRGILNEKDRAFEEKI